MHNLFLRGDQIFPNYCGFSTLKGSFQTYLVNKNSQFTEKNDFYLAKQHIHYQHRFFG